MASKSSLYGVPRSKPTQATLPTNAAFTSTLSSLLATSTSPNTSTTGGRPRPSKSNKPSIFTTHNKGSKKRALADISSSSTTTTPAQTHSQTSETVDAATLHRSKRKMEEKARLYASMKRGDYVPPPNGGTNKEENALVDFDRKWAESEDRTYGTETDDDGESEFSEEGEGGDAETVEYEDEFGRLRRGTKTQAARSQRRQNAQTHATESLSEMRARPTAPNTLIHGDVIQTSAFNPSSQHAAQISHLAAKRDRSPTPPAEVHYDASREVRSKGVGFYAFSQDKEGREREMEALRKEREETERGKREREKRAEERRVEVEERRKVIARKRGERLAERFLEGLDVP